MFTLHLRACVGGMCGRREVTRKTLAETRTARKKKSNTEPTSLFFAQKHFFGKPCTVQEKGLRQKSP